jgi:hypothetical protein
MSAFICSDEQFVRTVLGWAKHTAKHAGFNEEELAEMANTLKKENVRSVNWRYNEKTRAGKVRFPDVTLEEFEPASIEQVVQWLRCLDYQSCEHPDYEKSKAYVINVSMQRDLLMMMVGDRRFDSCRWII